MAKQKIAWKNKAADDKHLSPGFAKKKYFAV